MKITRPTGKAGSLILFIISIGIVIMAAPRLHVTGFQPSAYFAWGWLLFAWLIIGAHLWNLADVRREREIRPTRVSRLPKSAERSARQPDDRKTRITG
ncbi:hypothetical protein [Ferroacidibacillus organovorans]|uniref:Uncharacterized protein n=1 Tax=Ferroacidibacillus organovorans TaxID=1765683 RepID=A0A101XT50_9BACL|nr:hypothetical protein [Ferroacidibacillus organovorans]KUO97087.1 hypothetical protein ATW55_12285 [Ferroacidibacillus organovorans]